jgi:EPS-associated MarR family transcriptional regulator
MSSTPNSNDPVLEAMRAVEANRAHSQRELAAALGVSLGKSNYLMKALLERGWVKVKDFRHSHNKQRYLYYLTPTGIAEKSRRTRDFLIRKEAEYFALVAEIDSLRQELQAQPSLSEAPPPRTPK